MASAASVLTDNSTLSRLDRGLYRVEMVFALISGIAVFALMILAVVNVTGRNGLNVPVPGYVDWIEQAMPLIAFMGIAFTQRDGGHIRMDMLVGSLKGRALWLFELISVVLILCLMLLLIWGSWAHFDRSFDWTKPMWSTDSTVDLSIPRWPAKLLVPIAFSVLALRLVLQIVAYSRALVLGLEKPVAVPLIESVAETAAREAKTVSGAD